MDRTKGANIFDSQRQEPRSGMKSSAVGRMLRSGMLFFQMNECACDLDQTLEVEVIFVVAFEPEVLQNIVSLVVVPTVEALEKSGITGMHVRAARGFEGLDKFRDAVVLRHGVNFQEVRVRQGCGHRVCPFQEGRSRAATRGSKR